MYTGEAEWMEEQHNILHNKHHILCGQSLLHLGSRHEEWVQHTDSLGKHSYFKLVLILHKEKKNIYICADTLSFPFQGLKCKANEAFHHNADFLGIYVLELVSGIILIIISRKSIQIPSFSFDPWIGEHRRKDRQSKTGCLVVNAVGLSCCIYFIISYRNYKVNKHVCHLQLREQRGKALPCPSSRKPLKTVGKRVPHARFIAAKLSFSGLGGFKNLNNWQKWLHISWSTFYKALQLSIRFSKLPRSNQKDPAWSSHCHRLWDLWLQTDPKA